MKRTLVVFMILLLLSGICFATDFAGKKLDRDANLLPYGGSVVPVGVPSEIISSNSNSFIITPYNYILCIAKDGVQDTFALITGNTETLTTQQVVDKINARRIAGVYAEIFYDKITTNTYTVTYNQKVKIKTDSNSSNLQVIAKSTGAETIIGFSTSVVYATLPKVDVEVENIKSVDLVDKITLVDLITRITALESATIKYMPPDVIAGMTTLPAGTNRIGALSDTTFQAVDLDIRDLGAGDTVGAKQSGNWTVTSTPWWTEMTPGGVCFDTTTAGVYQLPASSRLGEVAIIPDGTVSDSVQVCVSTRNCTMTYLGGENRTLFFDYIDSAPYISWTLNGVTRLRVEIYWVIKP